MKGLPIDVQGVSVNYGDTQVLKGIDLSIAPGEFIALLGSSGCGKTTLLRALAGFIPVAAGDIRLGDKTIKNLPPEKRGIAMMFQSYALWPHMTVAQNVGYALRLRGHSKTAIADHVESMLELVGLEEYGERPVTRLSGGQRQRVALARALAVDPPVLLLDEPLSNLDARIRQNMRHEIKSLQKRLGLTTILVTHDREEAMAMADRVVILDQGRIVQAGAPEDVYHRPQSTFVAAFMGAENIYPVNVIHHQSDAEIEVCGPHIESTTRLPLAHYPDRAGANFPFVAEGPAVARFRSESAFLAVPGETTGTHLALCGSVAQHSYMGHVYRHLVVVGDHEFLVDHPQRLPVEEKVDICIPAAALHLFRESEGSAATSSAGEPSVPTP